MEILDETIQEKAFEIYDSFVRISPLYIDSKRNESAKKQATNCVDNIIKTLRSISMPAISYMETNIEFYEKVKVAIEKF